MDYPFNRHYIDGRWVESDSKDRIAVENPATQQVFACCPAGNLTDIDAAVRAAARAQSAWAQTPLTERIQKMQCMLDHFRSMRQDIIELEVQELGSPRSFAAATHCDYQFERIAAYIALADQVPQNERLAASLVVREPVGVVACITPWNYPLGQVVQKVIPAVLMGNTVVLKPSQHTPLTAFLLIRAFELAGFPAGVVNLVSGRGAELGTALATHPLVDMISFTGSTAVGVSLAQQALAGVKRISLELGGKSPYIWLKSDDYSAAVTKLFSSLLLNAGQTCTALSRLIVPACDCARIEALLVEKLQDYPVGDPCLDSTRIGPLASRAQFDKVCGFIRSGIEQGARLVAGGLPEADSNGYFVAPTIFSDVTNTMHIAREEIFGPVLCILTYDTLDEAVALANDTVYGLNAAVFGDRAQALSVARRLQAGNVYINDAPRDVTAPFGGYKHSGIGREGGVHGLMEFTQLKAIFDAGTF